MRFGTTGSTRIAITDINVATVGNIKLHAEAEADLGMFSMGPHKKLPPQDDRHIFVITKYSVIVG